LFQLTFLLYSATKPVAYFRRNFVKFGSNANMDNRFELDIGMLLLPDW